MAGLCTPLSTLHRHPRGYRRMTRGRCGLLLLHRSGLSPLTLCRFLPAHQITRNPRAKGGPNTATAYLRQMSGANDRSGSNGRVRILSPERSVLALPSRSTAMQRIGHVRRARRSEDVRPGQTKIETSTEKVARSREQTCRSASCNCPAARQPSARQGWTLVCGRLTEAGGARTQTGCGAAPMEGDLVTIGIT
jgi:hypothetical protein